MPEEGQGGRTPGLELVAFSRAIAKKDFAIYEDITLSKIMFKNIGIGGGYEKKRQFEFDLRQRAEPSQDYYRQHVKNMDSVETGSPNGTAIKKKLFAASLIPNFMDFLIMPKTKIERTER